MRFGMILLVLIAVLCAIAAATGRTGIYGSWYFILLFAMLAANLLFCSVLRVFRMKNKKRLWTGKVMGPFLTHFSMLLLMIAAALIFTMSKTQDLDVFPGDTCTLPDGTVLMALDFSPEDEEGNTHYKSTLSVTLPNGLEKTGTVEVNHPFKAGRYKIYLQDYGYAAVMGVKTEEYPEEETVWLNEPSFLSLDGENGISYIRMFGNVTEQDGEVMVSDSAKMIHPAYDVEIIEDGQKRGGLVYPGQVFEIKGVTYLFREPAAYPGFRIKTQPEWTLWLLYLSFALMIAGLYLCFFSGQEKIRPEEKEPDPSMEEDDLFQAEEQNWNETE